MSLGFRVIAEEVQNSVLIVEDDEQIAEFLAFLFQREGYATTVASDGKQGLAQINKGDRPDLVIMDVDLPYINGYELVKEARAKEDWQDTKIVMLSSKKQEKDIARGLNAGVNEYISKPFQPNELVACVQKIMQKDGVQ